MRIFNDFFKELFVTKCRICGKKYCSSIPTINPKICPKCCDELSEEMDEKNSSEYNEELRDNYNRDLDLMCTAEFILVGAFAMSIKQSVIIFVIYNLLNIALKIFLLWLEERKYSD